MSAASGALKPPPPVVIDRDAFKTTLRVRVTQIKRLGSAMCGEMPFVKAYDADKLQLDT